MTPTFTSGALHSTGWTGWTDVRALIGDDHCLWVDLTGAHHAPAPERIPTATHLWSWRAGRRVRVRIDGTRALATVFTEGDTGAGEPVTATVATGIPWRRHDRAARWDAPVTLVTTEGAGSITFIELES